MSDPGPRLPTTLICGTVRNGGAAFAATLQTIERLKGVFEDTTVVIVTNDNTDGTDDVLAAWSADNPKHVVIRLDGIAAAYPERIDRLAAVRNFYLHYLRRQPADAFKMMLVLDMDGPNVALQPDAFLAAINSVTVPWDGLFANQLRAYYDVYPLRHDTWSPDDCWERVAQANKGLFVKSMRKKKAINEFVYGRQVRIPPTEPLIRVRSAFGGLGLYLAGSLSNGWYASRLKNGTLVCDHVGLNTAMDQAGRALYIVPWLLNEAPEEHLRPSSGKAPQPGLFGR